VKFCKKSRRIHKKRQIKEEEEDKDKEEKEKEKEKDIISYHIYEPVRRE
jgi:hypothetical protein